MLEMTDNTQTLSLSRVCPWKKSNSFKVNATYNNNYGQLNFECMSEHKGNGVEEMKCQYKSNIHMHVSWTIK